MRKATVWTEHGWLYLRFPYRPEAVAVIKASFMPSDRQWDNEQKVWKIAAAHQELAMRIMQRFFEVSVIDKSGVQADELSKTIRALRPDLKKRLHRAMIRVLYPDAGGDSGAAAVVNHFFKGEI